MSEIEESLDPQDWSAFRKLAHRMVDDSLDHLMALRDHAPWTPLPRSVRSALADEPLPRTPQSAERTYEDFLANVLPYTNGNRHP
ncbi:MAG TPA: hypothetical protein VN613_07425, partial [Gemmatimonadaceae bacterium]|nr:hypothetical protein [Gemmatimonadaceae bacterium]